MIVFDYMLIAIGLYGIANCARQIYRISLLHDLLQQKLADHDYRIGNRFPYDIVKSYDNIEEIYNLSFWKIWVWNVDGCLVKKDA